MYVIKCSSTLIYLSTAPCKSQAGPMQALHTLNFKFVNFFSIVIQIKPL